jgi:hypothetical protein
MKNGDLMGFTGNFWDMVMVPAMERLRDPVVIHTIPSGKPCSALVVMLAHPVATVRAVREITHV